MRRATFALVSLLPASLAAYAVACSSDGGREPPATDAGADVTAVDSSFVDAPGDGSIATDANSDAIPADGGDGGVVFPTGPCGVVNASAPADGLFYDVGHVSPVQVTRHGDRLFSASNEGWRIWDLKTRVVLAGGPNVTTTPEAGGGVALVSGPTTGYETRSIATGALIHTFPSGTPSLERAYLASDGSYVAIVDDSQLRFYLPDGTPLRTIASSSLKTPDALPRSWSILAARASEIWLFDYRQEGQYEVIPKDGSPTRLVTGLPVGLRGFRTDADGATFYDSATMTVSFSDAAGVIHGAGAPNGSETWGNFAFAWDTDAVKVYSITGPTAALVATYPSTHTGAASGNDALSSTGYLLVATGLVSLRGATPVLTPIATLPKNPGAPSYLTVEVPSGDWAIGYEDGRITYGVGGKYDAYGRVSCGRVGAMSGSVNGQVALALADRVEVLDLATGAFVVPPLEVATSRVFLSETAGVLVTDDAAYALPTRTKIGGWTAADGLPLDLSPDGKRVAVAKPYTTVDVRATTGGAILESHASTVGPSAFYQQFARFSPDGSKLVVVRDVRDPSIGGEPIQVTTDLYGTLIQPPPGPPIPTTTTWTGYFPTYWIANDQLAGEALPSGARTPPRWDAYAGTFTWDNVGSGTSTPGAFIETRVSEPVFDWFARSKGGLLFDGFHRQMTKLDGTLTPPWALPTSYADGNQGSYPRTFPVTFSGSTFLWSVNTGVRRHAF